jgi:hypothetical protein
MASLKMRQSLAELEDQFAREMEVERDRRDSLIRTSNERSQRRGVERRNRRGSLRFVVLFVTLLATAALVTAAMFVTLYLLLAG